MNCTKLEVESAAERTEKELEKLPKLREKESKTTWIASKK